MTSPTSKQELQAFLRLATYMGPFIHSFGTLTSPLRELVKDGSIFYWSSAHQDAFDKIKNAISAETALGYYNPTKEIILQADASRTGFGPTLLQDQKPIVFASKTLTDAESRYANIQREPLAVVYRCKRFLTYLFGRSFVAKSDHKPLESIQMKNLVSASRRLQRMRLRLQPYDFTIRYRPGKQMHVADALSRLSSDESMPIPDRNVQVHEVSPQFSNEYLRKIQEKTPKDPELAALKEVVFNGWPNTIKELPPVLRTYWNYREELSIEDTLIMKRNQVIIPQVLQGDILAKLHASHQGTE